MSGCSLFFCRRLSPPPAVCCARVPRSTSRHHGAAHASKWLPSMSSWRHSTLTFCSWRRARWCRHLLLVGVRFIPYPFHIYCKHNRQNGITWTGTSQTGTEIREDPLFLYCSYNININSTSWELPRCRYFTNIMCILSIVHPFVIFVPSTPDLPSRKSKKKKKTERVYSYLFLQARLMVHLVSALNFNGIIVQVACQQNKGIVWVFFFYVSTINGIFVPGGRIKKVLVRFASAPLNNTRYTVCLFLPATWRRYFFSVP